MTLQWQDRHGVVHIIDEVRKPYAWCWALTAEMYAGKRYKPPSTDLVPTCIVCIANEREIGRIRRSLAG